jgi:hypothetical protein
MSYQQRERKRRDKVKAQQMVQGAKRTHSDETAVRYYLIYARKDCRCAAGGCLIRKGQEMVYQAGALTRTRSLSWASTRRRSHRQAS